MSKWYRESVRLVRALFGDRLKTELLVQMDGVGRDNSGVLILAATNLPDTLDPAIRRRFQKSIYIPLPDKPGRRRLFEISVRGILCRLLQADYRKLSRETEGFSGSDITTLVQDALMQRIRKIQNAIYYRQVVHHGQEKLTPCRPEENGAVPMTWHSVPPDKMLAPNVVADDFYSVLAKAKPSVGENEIQRCHN